MTLPFGQNFLEQGKLSGADAQNRPVSTTNSYARVVIFHYKKQSFEAINYGVIPSESDVFAEEIVIIEDELTSVSVNKSLSSQNPAGSFEIEVLPTKNFKSLVAPGDWALIYLYNGAQKNIDKSDIPNENIVMVGNVDRISRTRRRNEETDKLETRFIIGGRDHGKVFVETDLFINPYVANSANSNLIKSMLISKGLLLSGNPSTLTDKTLDVFLSSDGASFSSGSLKGQKTEPIDQWKIPRSLFNVLQKAPDAEIQSANTTAKQVGPFSFATKSPVSFGDALYRNIAEDLPGFKQRSFLTTKSNGNLWSLLEQNSNGRINEMFTDLERSPVEPGSKSGGAVKLSFVLRPRPNSPFFTKGASAGFLSALKGAYTDLNEIAKKSAIQISQDQIQFDNLGKSARDRFNVFWQTPKLTGDARTNEFANWQPYLGTGPSLPMTDSASIQRYGLKKAEHILDFAYETNAKNTGSVTLQRHFLNQFHDMHRFNHMYETGTMTTNGIYAEVGKVLKVSPRQSDQEPSKLYYIESYKHSWTFPNRWSTTLTLTRGQYELEASKNPTRPFIDADISDGGRGDFDFEQAHLVKSKVSRKGTGSSSKSSGFTFGGKDFGSFS